MRPARTALERAELGRLQAERERHEPEAAHAPWLEDPSVLPAIAAFLGAGGAA